MKKLYQTKKDYLHGLNLDYYESNFVLIVNDQPYYLSRFFADLISPKINDLHKIDETILFFNLDVEEEGDLNQIIFFLKNNQIELDDLELPYFYDVLSNLGNLEESQTFDLLLQGEITQKNVFKKLVLRKKNNQNNQIEIDFVAGNFFEILQSEDGKKSLKELDYETQEQILTNGFLNVNQDVLFQYILELYKESKTNTDLFQYLSFDSLSKNSIKTFMTDFDMRDLSPEIWGKVTSLIMSFYERTHIKDILPLYLTEESKDKDNFMGYDFFSNFLNSFDINIKVLPDDTVYPILINANERIASIKQKIFRQTKFPVNVQQLIFGGKVLEDNKSASDYNISKDNTILLHLRH